jgi:hypothetical protein
MYGPGACVTMQLAIRTPTLPCRPPWHGKKV